MQVSTVLEIKNLSAEGYYSVAGCRGLQLRVTKYGKEFYYRYTWQGKRVLLKIGNMKSVSLSDAEKRTFELAELVAKGINPKEKKTTTSRIILQERSQRYSKNVLWNGSKRGQLIISGKITPRASQIR